MSVTGTYDLQNMTGGTYFIIYYATATARTSTTNYARPYATITRISNDSP
jgi:hypothetical protein